MICPNCNNELKPGAKFCHLCGYVIQTSPGSSIPPGGYAAQTDSGSMKIIFNHQESYSRGQLLLRTFFGMFYIAIPHMFILMFLALWGSILSFIAWWAILFTAKYPSGMFAYQVNLTKWQNRVGMRLSNMADGYPAFGLNATDTASDIVFPVPAKLSRGLLLLKTFFGMFYVMIPHGFILMFRMMATGILTFLAWFSILFTGHYPASWFRFNAGTLRWSIRVQFYMFFMTDTYPPFNGSENN